MQRPAIRLIQLGLKSLGRDPGEIDSWWGEKTKDASVALLNYGPTEHSVWAVETLQRGLKDLGYYTNPVFGKLDDATYKALSKLVAADGIPKAAYEHSGPSIVAPKPPITNTIGGLLYQGSEKHVIDTYMLHCGALPGDWHKNKTNKEMLEAVRRMHTEPSPKGRGWSDIGYHFVVFPNGEILEGRPIERYGAGAVGHNKGFVHVLMIEVKTITSMGSPDEWFTKETIEAVKAHIEEMCQKTKIKYLRGHNEVASKLCPGFLVIDKEWTTRAVM